jgi:aryl-alcohol dehydrogenase-like predicted oxidoreductase
LKQGIGVPNRAAHTGEGLKKNVDKINKLKKIASRFELTMPQLAVAYVLAHPALTSALAVAYYGDFLR